MLEIDGHGQSGTLLRVRGEVPKDWSVSDWLLIDGVCPATPDTSEPKQAIAKIFSFVGKRGEGIIEVHPPIVPDGIYRNVNASPEDGAAIRLYGTKEWKGPAPFVAVDGRIG